MTSIPFDTLKFVETLKSHGLTDEQAKGIAAAFRDASAESEPVSRQTLQIELAPLRSDLLLIKWMLGLVVVSEVTPFIAKLFH